MEREPEHWKARDVARLLAVVETERRYYQEIVSSISAGVVIFSPELKVLSSNREARTLMGVRNGEQWPERLDELLPFETRAKVRQVLEAGTLEESVLLAGLRLSFRHIRNWTTDPSHVVLMTVQRADWGESSGPANQPGVPAPELLDSLDAIVWAVELPSKRFLFINEKAQEVLGHPKEKWLDNPEFWSERVHPEDRQSVTEAYDRAIQNWSRHTCEFRAVDSYGKVVWLRESARILQDNEGRARHLIGFGIDVTQRLMLETERIQAQRLEALGRMAERVSDEIAAQVAVIGKQSEQVIGSLAANSPWRVAMGEVMVATDRLRILAAQLASFNHVEPQPADPVEITDLLARCRPQIQQSLGEAIQLEMVVFPAPIGVRAGAGQLEAVVKTLVDKARRNLPGGGRITIECGPAEIDEVLQSSDLVLRPGVYGVISVEDDGPTLEPEDRAAVFESFLSARSSDLGPALSRAYNLVRQWRGDIVVSSLWPRGNRFQIYLPRMGERIEVPMESRRRGDPSSVVPEPPHASSEPRNRTILVVESDSSVRMLIEKMLRRKSYRVLEARDLAEASRACEDNAAGVDVLIADLMTPSIASPEMVERLRKSCPDLKILFLSGHPDEPERDPAVSIPGAEFLRKPFTLGSLMSRVQGMLGA